MAEYLLRQRATQGGIDVTPTSSGITFEGRPATDEAVDVMATMGIDLAPHRSRILDVDSIRSADLVIGMERLHVREAVVLAPETFGHTFTLKELVRRGESLGARRDEPVEEWMARVSIGRRPLDQLGRSSDDDVADPYGRSAKVYAATAAELDDLVSRLVRLMWGSVNAGRTA